jgi:hypothetical protein
MYALAIQVNRERKLGKIGIIEPITLDSLLLRPLTKDAKVFSQAIFEIGYVGHHLFFIEGTWIMIRQSVSELDKLCDLSGLLLG